MPARLPEEKVKCIEAMLDMNKPYREIVRDCGVTMQTVVTYARKLRGAQHSSEKPEEREEEPAITVGGGGMDAVLSEDIRFMIDMIKQKLDPRHPILAKLVENTAWWYHLILDFSKYAVPEVMSLLRAEEIDAKNPELTAKTMVSKFKALKQMAEERAAKIGEYEAKIKELENTINTLRTENEKLRKLLNEYRELVDESIEKFNQTASDMRRRVEETITFMIKHVPQALSPSERPKYLYVVVPKLREIWGG